MKNQGFVGQKNKRRFLYLDQLRGFRREGAVALQTIIFRSCDWNFTSSVFLITGKLVSKIIVLKILIIRKRTTSI